MSATESADLAPDVCRTLAEFVYGSGHIDDGRLAEAMAVLAHEATHLSRTEIDDEEEYPLEPPEYRSPDCRLGGPLDLALGDGPS